MNNIENLLVYAETSGISPENIAGIAFGFAILAFVVALLAAHRFNQIKEMGGFGSFAASSPAPAPAAKPAKPAAATEPVVPAATASADQSIIAAITAAVMLSMSETETVAVASSGLAATVSSYVDPQVGFRITSIKKRI